MLKGRALVLLAAALLYLVLPWDFDFIPLVGRVDDLLFLGLALWYAWKLKSAAGGAPQGERREAGQDASGEDDDPYRVLGVAGDASENEIKGAYRDLVARYHPDRLHHLGGEFREMAARKAVTINRAYEQIKRERGFS